jgi:hypothetical protein
MEPDIVPLDDEPVTSKIAACAAIGPASSATASHPRIFDLMSLPDILIRPRPRER